MSLWARLVLPYHPVLPAPEGYFTTMNEDRRVLLRDLAEELGLTPSALHQHARAGKFATQVKRNAKTVSATTAQKIKAWHGSNRNRTWPVFTEDEGSEEAS